MATVDGALVPPNTRRAADDRERRQVIGLLTGQEGWGAAVDLTDFESDTRYSLIVENQGTGGHINVPGIFAVNDAGVVIADLFVTDLSVSNDAAIGRDMTVTRHLTVNGNAALNGNTTLGNASGDAITVTGTPTFATDIVMGAAAAQIRGGATSWAVRNNADSADNLLVTNAGAATIRNGLTVTAGGATITAGGMTVTAGGATVSAGGVTVTGDSTVTGALNVTGILSSDTSVQSDGTVVGTQLVSSVATGTSPLLVSSQTMVTNLNAQFHGGVAATAFLLKAGGTVTGLIGFSPDNSVDLGAVGARPANIYYGTRMYGVGGEPTQKAPVTAICSGALVLTTTLTDVTGCSLSLSVGRWVVRANVAATCQAGDAGNICGAIIVVGTATATITNSGSAAIAALHTTGAWDTGTQEWAVQVTAAGTIKLQANKGGGAGASTVNATHTSLTATYAGNDI